VVVVDIGVGIVVVVEIFNVGVVAGAEDGAYGSDDANSDDEQGKFS